ncbi:MAG: YeeE/YedE thiosulfate transporter family protein [Myxococcales bacterium]|nr:YeeE/YedE thiosulfate transporter family protein [Myxococcales bacterium]MDD9965584.1 YeeE/YedE thiosulfate transporter family protein [Myxococcales bacterium]
MEHFTPISAAAGGILIGLASALLLYAQGRVLGVSGVLGGAIKRLPGDNGWRWAFLGGLVASGATLFPLAPDWFDTSGAPSVLFVAVAGLLVGYGTRLGNGCTSGHGVCGISRLSQRSMVATGTFMLTGMITALAVRLAGVG